MNEKVRVLMGGITYIETELIEDALSENASEKKKAAKSFLIKFLISAAAVCFIFSVFFPFFAANVEAVGNFTEKLMPEYYEYIRNFAINKKEVPSQDEDKMLYYSELFAFHDKSTAYMSANFTDELSPEEAEIVLMKTEDLLYSAGEGPIGFLEHLGFEKGSYAFEIQKGFIKTDIAYSKVTERLSEYMTKEVLMGILGEYVFSENDLTCLLCAKGSGERFNVLETVQEKNGFYTSVIASENSTFKVYYGITCEKDEYILGYYYCSPYTKENEENATVHEVTEEDMKEMISVAEIFLRLCAYMHNDPFSLLEYLGYTNADILSNETVGNYIKTSIDYNDFLSKMLYSMTEKAFRDRFSIVFQKDNYGKLCVLPGGGTGVDFISVSSLYDNGDGTYTVFACWEYGEGEYGSPLRFKKADGHWLVDGD